VVDSKLGVNTPMRINEAVLRSKLGAGTGLPVKIPEGMRAVSVKVNDVVSVAGFVVPGTHVDVLVTGSPGSNDQANVTTSTVLQDVPVLAAGKQFQRDSEGKPQDVPVITLQVSPADAQLLALASSEGRIQLSLRNPADVEKETTVAVHKGSLYGVAPAAPHRAAKGSSAKPPGPAIETYNVEVIRGTKREISKF
jgi:pilus assembly protein CpaB